MDAGAVQIIVPEINVWVNDDRKVSVNKINRESPGRMLVSEIMILANWLMAKFLAENGMPAIFRSQPDPRERLYRGDEGTLFQNWMQRRYLSRFVLDHTSSKHSGLGLDAYVTATSPIRKYFDLTTQRQLRALLGLEQPYTADEIDLVYEDPLGMFGDKVIYPPTVGSVVWNSSCSHEGRSGLTPIAYCGDIHIAEFVYLSWLHDYVPLASDK